MTMVRAIKGQSADSLIRAFNKKVQNEGLLAEFKQREFYQKPSTLRKEKKYALKRRIKTGSRGF